MVKQVLGPLKMTKDFRTKIVAMSFLIFYEATQCFAGTGEVLLTHIISKVVSHT